MELVSVAAGVAIGVAAMLASNHRASIARANERASAIRREDRMRSERDVAVKARDDARLIITNLRIDSANSAGYVDGREASRREIERLTSENAVLRDQVKMENLLDLNLRDGKRIVYGSFDK